MNWKVLIIIYGHGAATHVEISNISNREIEITKKAHKALDELPRPGDYDESPEGKNFEKYIFSKLKQYINKSRWDSLLDASFGTHNNIITFDTGY